MDGEVVELGRVALVEEERAGGQFLHDDVPGVHRPGARHQVGEDGVGREDRAPPLDGELLDDGIVRGRDGVEFPRLDPLQGRGRPRRHPVVLIVVLVEETAPQEILDHLGRGVVHEARQLVGALGDLAEIHLLDAPPIRPHGDGGLPTGGVEKKKYRQHACILK